MITVALLLIALAQTSQDDRLQQGLKRLGYQIEKHGTSRTVHMDRGLLKAEIIQLPRKRRGFTYILTVPGGPLWNSTPEDSNDGFRIRAVFRAKEGASRAQLQGWFEDYYPRRATVRIDGIVFITGGIPHAHTDEQLQE